MAKITYQTMHEKGGKYYQYLKGLADKYCQTHQQKWYWKPFLKGMKGEDVLAQPEVFVDMYMAGVADTLGMLTDVEPFTEQEIKNGE